MNKEIPRLRMFAGPNGSGKSTFKSMLRPELLGTYVNPDEIEKEIFKNKYLNLRNYGITSSAQELFDFFTHSQLLKVANSVPDAGELSFQNEKLYCNKARVNPYFASVAADFIRKKLIESGQSFTFETVMSFPDKIELLRHAQKNGYRTYLYYVATDDPLINISRVSYRVKMGGHSVPEDKIVSRYQRSLDLLSEAVQLTHRAYIFDNSTHEHIWLAEITNGKTLEIKTEQIPAWFRNALLNKLKNSH